MTARDIQLRIEATRRSSYAVLMPNFEPDHWHECDIFGVTRAGYFHEFEIKLSRADFRKDAKKRSHDRYDFNKRTSDWDRTPGKKKHDRLALGDEEGPSRFWYIVPPDMIEVGEVPVWAGLLIAHDLYHIQEASPAPKLHGAKVKKHVLRHAMNCCYYRFWNGIIHLT